MLCQDVWLWLRPPDGREELGFLIQCSLAVMKPKQGLSQAKQSIKMAATIFELAESLYIIRSHKAALLQLATRLAELEAQGG